MHKPYLIALAAMLGAALPVAAVAAPTSQVTVSAQDDVYKGRLADGSDGLTPVAVDVAGLTSITFDAVANSVTVNGGTFNDADGLGSVSGETNVGTTTQSGISAPTAGFLAGVFYSAATLTTAPAALNFNGPNGTDFATLSPELQQTFFIGDGHVGSGGAQQTFYIPTGATTLFLGLTDACGYSGAPSCYGDNSGSLTVTLDGAGGVSAAPEPGTWMLMLGGIGALGLALGRRRFKLASPLSAA